MKYKLVIFDLDGTIVDGTESIWKTLHEFFGVQEHHERLDAKEKFFSGEIGYREWARRDINILKKSGANRETVMKAVSNLWLIKGAMETLKALKEKGYKIAVVSGSMDVVLEKLIPNYKKIFDHVYINELEFDGKGEIRGIKETKFDIMEKPSGLKKICREENIKPEDCVFVGDHFNDIEIAKEAGFSISFNSKSKELDKLCDVVIRKKDLREILKHLE